MKYIKKIKFFIEINSLILNAKFYYLKTDEYQFQVEGGKTINQGHVPKIKDLTFRNDVFTRQSQSEKRNNIKYGRFDQNF